MPRNPLDLARHTPLDRSLESSRYQELALATAFEAALPIIRRRPDRTDPRREHPATSPSRTADPAAQGR